MRSRLVVILLCLMFIFYPFINQAQADIPLGVKDSYQYNKHDESIIIVKERLKDLGYFGQNATFSDFVSEELKNAIKAFQKQNNLNANGIINKSLLYSPYQKVEKLWKAISEPYVIDATWGNGTVTTLVDLIEF